jgi:PIN domain nuclease of toxin-antitoxin system
VSASVYDPSAFPALFLVEPGFEVVERHVKARMSSAVDLTEVGQFYMQTAPDTDAVKNLIAASGIKTAPYGREDALAAATLLPVTTPSGLSLGDRACLALARRLGIPALTADRAWKQLAPALGIAVELIR